MTREEARAAAAAQTDAILARIEAEGRQATSEELSQLEALRAQGAEQPPTPKPSPTPSPNRMNRPEMRSAQELRSNLRSLFATGSDRESMQMSIEELRAVTFAESTGTDVLAPVINGANRGNLFQRLNWVEAPAGNAAFTVYPAIEGAFVPMGVDATDGFTGTGKALTPKRLAAATIVPLTSWEAASEAFFSKVLADLGISLFRGVEKKLLDKNVGSSTAPAGIFAGSPAALAGAVPTTAEIMAMAGEVHAKTGNPSSYVWVMDAATYYACMNLTVGQVPLVQNGKMLGFDVICSAYAPANLGAGTKKGIALIDGMDCFATIFPDVLVRVDYTLASKGQVRLLAEASADIAWALDGFAVRQLA